MPRAFEKGTALRQLDLEKSEYNRRFPESVHCTHPAPLHG